MSSSFMPFSRECSRTQARWSEISTAFRRWRIRVPGGGGKASPPPVVVMDIRDWRRDAPPSAAVVVD